MSPGPGPGHYSVVKWTCANVDCDSSKMGPEMALMLDETWNKLEKHNRYIEFSKIDFIKL